ncbi:hypothetical protein NEMBOFW57_008158 [Staphylotrichum longicolle]|uniref:Uncharacterized protein n=1 Tax=Staphylotrichum longicolle TaxID=669026 RepID=A0AAD4ER84_9PEZI|nr:hypothetical protein NEMBOFW57_008158 [Staphylotrichum longicolle]
MSYQGNSNVGFRALYESQNQRNHKQSEVEELTRQTGENVKGYLPKLKKTDPTFAAMMHGNKPSPGAIIDKEIQDEEEAMLRRKSNASARKKSESY